MCQECMGNPFLVERYRVYLSKTGNFDLFIETYSDNRFTNFTRIDTGPKWDHLIKYHRLHHEENLIARMRLKTILDLVPRDNDLSILDVGFGYGDLLYELQKDGLSNIVGIDISREAIAQCRDRVPGCMFVLGEAANTPLKDEHFDLVLLNEVLEHIPVSRTFAVYEEMRRVLRKEGRVVISVPVGENLETTTFLCPHGTLVNQNGHVRTYTGEVLEMELRHARIEPEKMIPVFPPRSRSQKISRLIHLLTQKMRGNPISLEPSNLIVVGRKR